jgi:2,4-dienoyl-CoA reductase (NADPH2)
MVPWLTGKTSSMPNHHDDDSLQAMATYFSERAAGGVGLMVTGGIAPSYQGWAGPFAAQLTTEAECQRHKVVTDAVHAVQVPVYGSQNDQTVPARICLQILHTGRYAYHPFAVSASKTKSPISPFSAAALSKRGVAATTRDFVHTAVLAKQAGYDGVEIMGSEGYLLSQFLAPRTNHRTDEYGGSLANRARLPLEIVRQTRQAVGLDFIIIFRLSLLDLVKDGLSFDESVQMAHWLQDAGVTIINTGIGWHEARVPTIATSVPRAAFGFPTTALRHAAGEELTVPLVATNRINNPVTAEDVLSHDVDLISMARPFLADPQLMSKSRDNREDEINTCIGCNQVRLLIFVFVSSFDFVILALCHWIMFIDCGNHMRLTPSSLSLCRLL